MRMLDASGRVLVTLVPAPFETGLFGDSSDLGPTFDGANTYAFCTKTGTTPNFVYTLTRSVFCSAITIGHVTNNVRVVAAGFKVFCAGTLSILNNGVLSNNGIDAVGQTAGAALAAVELGGGSAGGAGGAANTAGSNAPSNSANPTMGGTGASGGAGAASPGTGGSNTLLRPVRFQTHHLLSGSALVTGGSGGGGGGGGGTAIVGGGGGGGGGVLMVYANSIQIDTLGSAGGLISGRGGAGAAGGNASGAIVNGGGGGGGGGGLVYLCYYSLFGSSKITAAGGSGGAAGTGGAGGAAGSSGGNGVILRYNMQTRTWE